jgi:hypothetical protein
MPIILLSTPRTTYLGKKTQPNQRCERFRRIVSQVSSHSLLKTYCVTNAITGTQETNTRVTFRGRQEATMKVYIGIDWSEKKHDICFMHENGEVLRNLQILHTMDGFVALDKACQELGVSVITCGIKTINRFMYCRRRL